MPDCLMLNADFRPLSNYPLSLIGWQDAIRLVFLGKVQVVENHSDWVVHSANMEMPVPAVVATTVYVSKKSRSVAFSRRGIYQRDMYVCQYCGKDCLPRELTLDHVIPKSRGGKTDWENIVAACIKCNQLKGDKMDMKPRVKPMAPGYDDVIRMLDSVPKGTPKPAIHELWKDYR